MRFREIALSICLAGCAHAAPANAPAVDRAPAPAASAPSARVVDKVVAVVQNRPITLSECELEVRLQRAITGDVAGAMGAVGTPDEARVLPVLVDRAAILRALKRSYPSTLDPQMSRSALKALRSRFPTLESWHAFL